MQYVDFLVNIYYLCLLSFYHMTKIKVVGLAIQLTLRRFFPKGMEFFLKRSKFFNNLTLVGLLLIVYSTFCDTFSSNISLGLRHFILMHPHVDLYTTYVCNAVMHTPTYILLFARHAHAHTCAHTQVYARERTLLLSCAPMRIRAHSLVRSLTTHVHAYAQYFHVE